LIVFFFEVRALARATNVPYLLNAQNCKSPT